MKKYIFHIAMLLALLCSCKRETVMINELPPIFPDYIGVTIPVGIAPLNFNLTNNPKSVFVQIKGENGDALTVKGSHADFPIRRWHKLLESNKGGKLYITVLEDDGDKWLQYKDFIIFVSEEALDDYGITYRKMAPGYLTYSKLGIYQRNIHNFDEDAIVESTLLPGHCVGCHTANQTDPEHFMFHIRGKHGGTVEQVGGKSLYLNTKAEGQLGSVVYTYWHPSSNYYACSTNIIRQCFWTGNDNRIEVFDEASDVMIMNARTHELITYPQLSTSKRETYPAFSADGKTLYFCVADDCPAPAEAEKIKYNLCAVAFDENTGEVGQAIDTLINAKEELKSVTMPRPSYDGRWLMYCKSDFSCFPINRPEADLWIMDLVNGETWPLTEANSVQSESFHNWSSNSKWFLFSSRRGDGVYGKTYIACIDEDGKSSKPFLLPQKNPLKYYSEILYAFNVPDFTKKKVKFNALLLPDQVFGDEQVKVSLKNTK